MVLHNVTFRTEPCTDDPVTLRRIVTSTGVFRSDEIAVAVELIEERLSRGVSSGYYFIFAEQGGSMLGYTCYGPIACTISGFDLYWIAVEKEHHGKKIGSLLMAETERLIAETGGRRVYIETSSRADYQATRGFYLRHHYTIEATIKDFYDEGDDKVIYSKVLT